MSISNRLTLLTALFGAFIFSVLILFLTLRARAVLLEHALSDVKETAENVAAEVRRWEETIIRSADAIRLNAGVRAMDPRAHADAFAGGFTALNDYMYTLYSIDGEGTQFVLRDGSTGSGFRGDRTYFTEAMAGRPVSRQVLMGRSLDPPAPAVAYGFPIPGLTDGSSTEAVGFEMSGYSYRLSVGAAHAQSATKGALLRLGVRVTDVAPRSPRRRER